MVADARLATSLEVAALIWFDIMSLLGGSELILAASSCASVEVIASG